MADVNELLDGIRMNLDMAELYDGAYFNEARRLLMNDLAGAINDRECSQDPEGNKLQIGAVKPTTATPSVDYSLRYFKKNRLD